MAALRTRRAVAQRADEKWPKTVQFVAIGLILAHMQVVWWVRMASRRRWTRMRERIACDLHDEIGANVSSIGHSAEMILLDLKLPRQTGLEFIPILRQAAPDSAIRKGLI